MCGIVGYVGQAIESNQLHACLERATQLLARRGPDGGGIYLGPGVGLGAARLAIRDIERGLQPMRAEDGTVVVFNGELYSVEDIRCPLRQAGYAFKTSSDTEVLLEGYRMWGDAIVQRLSGMFAFAIWSPSQHKLILARDRWGEKPLFFACGQESLIFASEIKALRQLPGADWRIRHEDIYTFLRHGYLPGERTGWQGVRKLLPGMMLIWEDGKLSIRDYAQTPLPRAAEGPEPSLESASRELHLLIDKAVRERLVSDRPIGALLSGGIDSSTVVGLMSRYISPVRTFSIRWLAQDYTEESHSREISHHFGTLHREILCTSAYFLSAFDGVATYFDELFGDESMIPTAMIAEAAKEDVDVVLSGDGADELFAGYERYQNDQCFADYLEVCTSTQLPTMDSLCSPGLFDHLDADRTHISYYEQVRHLDPVSARRWIDLHTYLPSQILTKVDRMTMRVGLESRAPFLDPTLAEWALRCDPRLICSHGIAKRVLKTAVADLLPPRITNRSKQGFGVPLVHWFRGSLSSWIEERLFCGSLKELAWLESGSIRRLVDEHKTGDHNHYRILFNLAVVETWLRNCV
jgi:asparagine synthase (glutamine-hydrolysing)